MNIRSLRIYSVPIRINLLELHVSHTCFLHELNFMERYVTTTYPLHGLHMCIQGGYVPTTHPKYKFNWYVSINKIIGLSVP